MIESTERAVWRFGCVCLLCMLCSAGGRLDENRHKSQRSKESGYCEECCRYVGSFNLTPPFI